MKEKLLFCLVLFGFIAANSQTLSDNNCRLIEMPNPRSHTTQVIKTGTSPSKDTRATSKRAEDGAEYEVNFILDFDDQAYRVEQISLVSADRTISSFEQLFDLVSGSNIMYIPSGTYDIIVDFVKYGLPPIDMYVVREQVTIGQDISLSFAPTEAKNHIHFQTLTIDGEPVFTGKYAYDEDYNLVELEPGNVDEVYFEKRIACAGLGSIVNIGGNFGVVIEGESGGGEMMADVFINDVSDRYSFYQYRSVIGQNYDIYTSAYEVNGAAGNVTVTNDPSKFVLFEDPFIDQKRQGEELFHSFQEQAIHLPTGIGSGRLIVFSEPITEGQTYKYYLSASVEDSQAGFMPIIEPGVSVKTIEVMPWGDEWETTVNAMVSMPLTVSDGEAVFANNGVTTHADVNYPSFNCFYDEAAAGSSDIKYYPQWPSHPVFTYSVDKKKDILGNNCPLLVSNPMQYSAFSSPFGGDPFIDKQFCYNYIGRYGETNLDDVSDTQVNIQLNGQDFYAGNGRVSADLDALNGIVDAIFVNESITVDGIEGLNKTNLHYNTEGENSNPPTMTMLHFKNSNGDVTDRFASAEDGIIEFSAGDFNLVSTPKGYFAFDRIAPASVEVSYSQYGENKWKELAVEEDSENYYPAMGWFYAGSLAGVTGQSVIGWYDLKVRLTDSEGNWQEQVISPAFYVEDLIPTAITEVTPDNEKVDNTIYNMSGQRVYGDLESLPRGIYIVGGKKVVK